MPIIFIHGVNTRRSPDAQKYEEGVAARDELLKRLVLMPLAEQLPVLAPMLERPIVNPYWGDVGVAFRFNQASLPELRTFEHLGAEQESTVAADLALAICSGG